MGICGRESIRHGGGRDSGNDKVAAGRPTSKAVNAYLWPESVGHGGVGPRESVGRDGDWPGESIGCDGDYPRNNIVAADGRWTGRGASVVASEWAAAPAGWWSTGRR